MAEVTIRVQKNGPLVITGPVRMLDSQNRAWNLEGRGMVALCRCGQSSLRPFCDGTHARCGFQADEPAR